MIEGVVEMRSGHYYTSWSSAPWSLWWLLSYLYLTLAYYYYSTGCSVLTLRRSGTSKEFFLMHHKSKKNYSKWRQIPKRNVYLYVSLWRPNCSYRFRAMGCWQSGSYIRTVCTMGTPHFVKNGELKLSRNKLFTGESFRRNHIHFSLICCYIYVGIQWWCPQHQRSGRWDLWLYWFGNSWSSRSTTRFAKELLSKRIFNRPIKED